jgi:hypothetical protein
MSESITKFEGESTWDALVNHYSLTIEQEDDFISYLEANGTAPGRCNLEQLQAHYEEWQRLFQDC